MAKPEQRPVVRRVERIGSGESWRDDYLHLLNEKSSKTMNLLRRNLRDLLKDIKDHKSNQSVLAENSGQRYLDLHRRLHFLASHPLSELKVPGYHQYDIPYWQVPFSDTQPLLYTRVSPQLDVWSGPLASFDLGLRALVVDMAMQVYAQELLHTDQLAQHAVANTDLKPTTKRFQKSVDQVKARLEAQLLLAMCHSFRPEYVLGIAFAMPDGPEGERHLVGSIGAVRGVSDQPMGWTRGRDGSRTDEPISSLPTNAALYYFLNEVGRALANIPEEQFAEVTRLNVAPPQVCERLGIADRGQISQTLMYLIHQAIQENFPGVEWEIFNTQLTLHRIIRMMGLPAEIISEAGTVRPTQAVVDSIHGAYFQRTPPTPQVMRVSAAVEMTAQKLQLEL